LQQSVARKQRFSQNWKKAKGKLEKAYDHVTNRKKDFLHKLSRRYVDTYKTICVEDLQRRRSNICCLGISSYRAISDTITLSVPTASVR
jgi:transposase